MGEWTFFLTLALSGVSGDTIYDYLFRNDFNKSLKFNQNRKSHSSEIAI
jgi:hypothetical protein